VCKDDKPQEEKPASINFIDDISQISIEPEEIVYFVSEMNKAHDSDGEASLMTQVIILAKRYPE
jgi:hypothetical protein